MHSRRAIVARARPVLFEPAGEPLDVGSADGEQSTMLNTPAVPLAQVQEGRALVLRVGRRPGVAGLIAVATSTRRKVDTAPDAGGGRARVPGRGSYLVKAVWSG